LGWCFDKHVTHTKKGGKRRSKNALSKVKIVHKEPEEEAGGKEKEQIHSYRAPVKVPSKEKEENEQNEVAGEGKQVGNTINNQKGRL